MAYTAATFFLDFEGGSDTARTALTSCVASNPAGSTTRINKTGHGLTTGAVVDLTAFTSWLNSAWKITVVDVDNFDLDDAVWQSTADANGTATPRGGSSKADAWKTINSGATSSRHQAGDTIRIMASPDPTSLGQSVTWTDNSDSLTLTSAVTVTVDNCETAWTAAANVTATATSSSRAEGTNSNSLAFAAGFTTGLAAYKQLSNLDLSAYQQLSFWIRQGSAANTVSLKLFSGTDGATGLLATLTIPYACGVNDWSPVTIDNGSALPSGINSIGLYTSADPSTATWYLDHIIACKAPSAADSLSLRSMIGKNVAGENYEWWPIRYIDGTTVGLGMGTNNGATVAVQKYHGTTESVTTYKRESLNLSSIIGSGYNQTVPRSGTSAGFINYSGGWNRTDMTTQTGWSWLSSYSTRGGGSLIATNSLDLLSFDKIGGHICMASISFDNGSSDIWSKSHAASGVRYGFYGGGNSRLRADDIAFVIAEISGVGLNSLSVGKDITLRGNRILMPSTTAGTGLQCTNGTGPLRAYFTDIIGAGIGVDLSSEPPEAFLYNCRVRRSVTASMSNTHGLKAFNCSFEDATQMDVAVTAYSMKDGQTADQHKIFWNGGTSAAGGLIVSATDQRHTASGIAWKFSPLNITYVSEVFPMSMSVAKIAVAASALVTISLWMRRDNTGLSMNMRVPGGQIAGVASDVIASMSEAVDTWGGNGTGAALSLTFTPTEAGVVELFVDVWGGTSYNGWIDDLTVSQA